MEDDYRWHGMAPNEEQSEQAIAELDALRSHLESEHE
jgi:hypothetical protein